MIKKIKLLKKNRVYFQAETNGYKCKVYVNEFSENLELNKEHELLVDDCSIKSKYGTDLKFRVVKQKKEVEPIFIAHGRYNQIFADECRKLNGKWNREYESWEFSGLLKDKIEDLDYLFNSSEDLTIELEALERTEATCKPLTFCGYTLASAFDRDSGAKIHDNIVLLSGRFGSGGSAKNWRTIAEKGTKLIIKIPKLIFEKYKEHKSNDSGWKATIKNN